MTSREVSGTSQAVTEASGTITVEETVPNRLRYNGQMADGLTGLYYLRARYYNASLGRFTQEDVIYNDGLNLYAYCGSNPVMYEDPSGYAKKAEKQKICGSKENGSLSGYGNYKFKEGVDVDLRGKGKYRDAIKDAFNKTGVPKENFEVTKWGKNKNGKSFPVEWRADNGAEVNIDLGHSLHGDAPTVPHVGWQTGGKRANGGVVRGHIFVDDVPYNR